MGLRASLEEVSLLGEQSENLESQAFRMSSPNRTVCISPYSCLWECPSMLILGEKEDCHNGSGLTSNVSLC